MKIKSISIVLFASLFMLTVSSCNSIVVSTNNRRIEAFEKAIDNLSENHSTMTQEKLEKAVLKCDKFKEKLQDEERAYTEEQRKRVDKLCNRYWLLRMKIKVTHRNTVSANDIGHLDKKFPFN